MLGIVAESFQDQFYFVRFLGTAGTMDLDDFDQPVEYRWPNIGSGPF